uniref:hypothetical protein n=1 Tax=Sphingomonas sp. CCH18-H6 TaxID=1768787 RepID=UPI001E34637C
GKLEHATARGPNRFGHFAMQVVQQAQRPVIERRTAPCDQIYELAPRGFARERMAQIGRENGGESVVEAHAWSPEPRR